MLLLFLYLIIYLQLLIVLIVRFLRGIYIRFCYVKIIIKFIFKCIERAVSLEKISVYFKIKTASLYARGSIDIVSIEIFVKIFRYCIALKFYYINRLLNI